MHPGTRLKALQGSSIRKHPAIKPTSSTNEGMTGATLNYLYLLMMILTALPYIIQSVDEYYFRIMKLHLSSVYVSGSKAFECTVCGKGLARKDKLTIHMRIHTGGYILSAM